MTRSTRYYRLAVITAGGNAVRLPEKNFPQYYLTRQLIHLP
jgi:hypothetical protein